MPNLPDLLTTLRQRREPTVLATLAEGAALGARELLEPGQGPLAEAAAEVLAGGGARLVAGTLGETPGTWLLEALVPAKLPPWLQFTCLLLARGKSCVLATVVRVAGDLPYAVGERFAYDAHHHGLLPMDSRLSLDLQRACAAAREAGVAQGVTLQLAGGSLGFLLEPLQPAATGALPTVILAAGASRRLGRPKQLVVFEGETLLRRIARTALVGGGPVSVVVGAQAQAMEEALAGLPVDLVFNRGWEEGMASSVRAGMEALPAGAAAVLLLLCDQPAVDAALLERLRAAHRADPQAVVACGYGGGRGTPALLPSRCFPELRALRGDQGARGLIQGEDVVVIPFPEGERDVDRPEDLP